MIRSVISMHSGKEYCVFIGLTPHDVEYLSRGNGLRFSTEDMKFAGMPEEMPVSLAFVWGDSHEEIVGQVTETLEEFGKEVDVVHEGPHKGQSDITAG